jgi:protease PrsW
MASVVGDSGALWSPRETLDRCEMFQGTTADVLDTLASQAVLRAYPAGTTLFRQGEPGDEAFIIARGQAEVVKLGSRGQETVLAVLDASACTGEMAVLLQGQPRTATVRARTDVRAYAISSSALRAALRSDPELAAQLSQRMEQLGVDAFLKMASPFVRLPGSAIYELAGKMRKLELPAGTTLMRQGESADTFYLLQRGRVVVRRDTDGTPGKPTDDVVAYLGPGDCFGEAALLTDAPRSATVETVEPAQVLELSRADFDSVVREHQSARAFFRELSLARYRKAPKELLSDANPITTLLPRLQPSQAGRVLGLFGGGLVLLAIFSALSMLTNQRAFAWITLVLGALLPAVSYVAYIRERHLLRDIPVVTLLVTGVLAGAIAVPLAIALQQSVHAQSALLAAFLTALTEEPLKLIGVLWVMSRRQYRFALDGVIFGITAAMGFGGLETLGYGVFGLTRPLQLCGIPDGEACMVQTLWLRVFTAFLGHGPWTAIICAVIWRERGRAGSWLTRPVLVAFLFSVALHTLWDTNLFFFGLPVAIAGIYALRRVMEEGLSHQAEALSALSLLPEGAASTDTANSVVCQRCGTRFPASAVYCVRCGLALV